MAKVTNRPSQTRQLQRADASTAPKKAETDKPGEAPAARAEPSPDQTPLAEIDAETAQNLARRQGEAPKQNSGMLGLLLTKKESADRGADAREAWFSTDWFHLNKARDGRDGDPGQNLWAAGGPLDKLDAVARSEGRQTQARSYETEHAQSVSYGIPWAGNCNDASLAGLVFERPRRPVTVEGRDEAGAPLSVTFTPRDIEGLLTVVAADMQAEDGEFLGARYDPGKDQLRLKDGHTLQGEVIVPRGAWERAHRMVRDERDNLFRELSEVDLFGDETVSVQERSGRVVSVPAREVESALVQSGMDVRPWELRDKVLAWAREGGGVADVDPMTPIYNRPFRSARSEVLDARPAWATPDPLEAQHPPGLRRQWGELEVDFGDRTRTFRYWTVYDGDQPVDGGWYRGNGADPPPDFLWRPENMSELRWPEQLSRNPWVDVALVKRLYQQSIADE